MLSAILSKPFPNISEDIKPTKIKPKRIHQQNDVMVHWASVNNLKSGTVVLYAGDAGGLTVMDNAHDNKSHILKQQQQQKEKRKNYKKKLKALKTDIKKCS